ncbi:MBL fold metallo-hydrolase [Dyella sp. 2RAB6]|uniref:MBL fold metallo-hydrolase n=1 Tax=Dyella sp. 2RAB6 TaxID=3232992 RepID=UPI003F930C7C
MPAPGQLDAPWQAGKADCSRDAPPPIQVQRYNADCSRDAPPPIQVQRYNQDTYVLRENPCITDEAPFMYLLVGTSKALLIDSGDVADAKVAPLASTVASLLPTVGGSKLPLVVVHTHGHLDHREGDAQFASMADVQVVGSDLPSVQQYFKFQHWPDDVAQLDLGDRIVDVIPTPGHHPAHVSYYDRSTALVFSGDAFLPGRLLIDDTAAARRSAERLVAFLQERPVAHVMGGHVEMDKHGELILGGTERVDERPLELSKQDLSTLPHMLADYNGFYSREGNYVIYNQNRVLGVLLVVALALLVAVAAGIRTLFRRRRRRLAAA